MTSTQSHATAGVALADGVHLAQGRPSTDCPLTHTRWLFAALIDGGAFSLPFKTMYVQIAHSLDLCGMYSGHRSPDSMGSLNRKHCRPHRLVDQFLWEERGFLKLWFESCSGVGWTCCFPSFIPL